MSFGAAAGACPCGSGGRFDGCCGPLLAGNPAATPERLMRSRYTAFARGDSAHLLRTRHPRTRPAEVAIEPTLRWQRLEVLDSSVDGDDGIVEFRAHWSQDGEHGVLHERSTFVRRGGRWVYVAAE